ncbi:MAG: ABC transporter ATP-binding protein [Rhodospirillales bacterium]|nr:ABC transporter ATP-binding protein [Rhodospirillales bacterium]
MAGVTLTGVVKRFNDVLAVDAVDMAIVEGEFVALLGPSGCGKTTLLRLIAGFETPDEGTVALGDEVVSMPGRMVPAERRRIGMVFQSYALWPHMTVGENVGYPLRVRRVPSAERRHRVAQALAAVGLEGLEERRPAELSGGQRQRVALARCLSMESRVVLLDEPLANLDAHLRESMQAEFRAFHAATGATMIYVTHDQSEAMALADRVAVMNRGRVEQMTAPADLYRRPATDMVAQFVGRGMVVPAEVRGGSAGGSIRARVLGAETLLRCNGSAANGSACLRPEGLELVGPDVAGSIVGRVVSLTYTGATTTVHVRADAAPDRPLHLHVANEPPPPGARVGVRVTDGWLIPGKH